jgi:hypothetical protein
MDYTFLGYNLQSVYLNIIRIKAFRTSVVKEIVFLRTLKQWLQYYLPGACKENSLSVGHDVI